MTGKSFTLNDIKLFIEKKSWAKNIISTSTIRKILTKNLRMAFKRMNKLNSSIILKEKINQIRDILFIQFKLLNNNSNVIFLDEFKFASESTKYFGWSKRNQNCHLFMNPDKFNASFMIAF